MSNRHSAYVGYVDPEPFGLGYTQQHGIAVGRHHPSLSKLLAAERLDLLMIGSPNHLHLEQLAEALQHDMPIFCEKPVVATEAQTYELLRLLANGADSRILIGLVLRYTTLYEDTMAAIRDGTIGEISSIEASEHIAPYHGAFFMRDWRRYEAYSGCFLLGNAATTSTSIEAWSAGARCAWRASAADAPSSRGSATWRTERSITASRRDGTVPPPCSTATPTSSIARPRSSSMRAERR